MYFSGYHTDGFHAVVATTEKIKSVEPAKLNPALHPLKTFEGFTGSPRMAFEVMADGSCKITGPSAAVAR